jgi:outer membrane protein TolC
VILASLGLSILSAETALAQASSDSQQTAAPRITLQQAVERALAQNPSSITAELEFERSRDLVQQARAAWMPTLVGNGFYTRIDHDRILNDRVISARDQLSANAQLTLPLFVPSRWAQWSRASENVNVTRAAQEDVRRQIAVAAARAYLTVIAQRRVVVVNERSRDTAKAHLAFASARFTGGVGNRIDEVRAAQELNTVESQLQAFYAALVRARETLAVLIGADGPVEVMDEVVLESPPSVEVALEDARTRRADLQALEARQRAAEKSKRDNWTDYAPLLSVVLQPFYQNPSTLTQPLTGWQGQLILTVPFYDGGLRYGLGHEREHLLAESRVALEGGLRQARSEVRTSFEGVQRADESLKSARDAARFAAQALELANLAYRAGATTNIEVVDAERRARDADTAAVIAEDNARQARLELLASSGHFP